MVEVESSLRGPAVHAAVLTLVGIQPFAAFLYVAGDVASVAFPVVAIALGLPLLVALPRLGRVVDLATSHTPILADYWGDESLGTAEMPGEAA